MIEYLHEQSPMGRISCLSSYDTLASDARAPGARNFGSKHGICAAKAPVEMTEGSRRETAQLTKMSRAECKTAICHAMVIVEGIQEAGLFEQLRQK